MTNLAGAHSGHEMESTWRGRPRLELNHLARLPTEIRLMIFEHIVIDNGEPILLAFDGQVQLGGQRLNYKCHHLAILRSCRQYYQEGSKVFFPRTYSYTTKVMTT